MTFNEVLFDSLGPLGTSLALCGILAVVGLPALAALFGGRVESLRRLPRSR